MFNLFIVVLFLVGIANSIEFASRVANNNDNAEEAIKSGYMYLMSSDLELINDIDYGDQIVGLRFQNVLVPKDAQINNVNIEFIADETGSSATSLTFRGQASDDPPAFSNSYHDLSRRPLTSSSVDWKNVPAWATVGGSNSSPDLRPIAQEIVNRPGWSPGNAIVFVISGSGRRTAESFAGNAAKAPLLRIDYQVSPPKPTATTPQTPPAYSVGDLKPGHEWKLVFADEFDGTTVNSNNWETAWFSSSDYTKPLNDAEDGCYHPSQVSVRDGSLRLKAQTHSDGDCLNLDGSSASYVTGLVNTRKSFTFKRGYVEARIWIPNNDERGIQTWPSFWSTGCQWPTAGEIDIMQVLSELSQPCFSYHWGGPENYESFTKCANMKNPAGWHTFGVLREDGMITVFYDKTKFITHKQGVVSSPHYLVLNQAVRHSDNVQVADPVTMLVDYVRVWSPDVEFVYVPPFQPLSMHPVEETFAKEIKPTTNYAFDTRISVKRNDDRIGYIKFDISNVPGSAPQVLIRMWAYTDRQADVSVHEVTSDWSQDKVTWNYKPTVGPKIDTKTYPQQFESMTFDVTEYVNRQVDAGANYVSFAFASETNDSLVKFYNTRWNLSTVWPTLEFGKVGEPPKPPTNIPPQISAGEGEDD